MKKFPSFKTIMFTLLAVFLLSACSGVSSSQQSPAKDQSQVVTVYKSPT